MVKKLGFAFLLFIVVAFTPATSFAQNPPFTQCPAIGIVPAGGGCNILIVVTSAGPTILFDPHPGTIDGSDDVSVGVQNNSGSPIASLPLISSGGLRAFGFESDGLCGLSPHPTGCPFGPTGYEGPGTSFSNISSDFTSGTVNFSPPIPPGGSAYFSLEDALTAATFKINFSINAACPLPDPQTNYAYQQILTASGGTAPFTWAVLGALPPGLALSPNTGVISGVATVPGPYSFTLQATDSSPTPNVATLPCSTQVDPGPVAITSPCPLPPATAGVSYSATLTAAGGVGTPNFTVSGALPPGLFFANNMIQGDPSTPGVYNNFSLVLGTQSQTCSLTVNANPITFNGCPLVAGAVGTDYNQTLTASGGTAPYAFFSSGLPGGLTLMTTDPGSATTPGKAVISGRPTGAGTANVIVSVTDKAGRSNGQFCTLSTLFSGGDLLLSNGTFNFSAPPGGIAPPVQNLSIISGTGSAMPFVISGTVPKWLSFSALSGTTPGLIKISVDPSAQSASTTPLTASFNVSAGPSGTPHPLTVNFNVQNAPPQLGLSAPVISLATPSSSPVLTTQGLQISNIGGGNLTFNATVLGNPPWLTIVSPNGAIGPGGSNTIIVNADPSKVQPGYNRAVVNIKSNSGPDIQVPVTFLVSAATLTLNPSGSQFQARQGNPASNPNRSFSVQTLSTTPISWTAQNLDAAPWLVVTTPSGTSTVASPGSISYTVNASVLPVGTSYARIRVSSGAAVNSPQDFIVVLNVVPSNTPPVPDPQPAGLIFVSRSGNATTQSVIDYTSSATPLAEQVSVSTDGGLTWLSASAVNGTTSSLIPDQINVTANGTGLPGGVYRGNVNLTLGGLDVRSVNATLIVPTAATEPPAGETSEANGPPGSCAASKAIPTQTGLTSNFSSPVAWPRPISVQLVSDCGDFLSNGQVVVIFSNGDPPLALSLNNAATGLYAGTWVPQGAGSQVAVTALGSAPGLQPTSHQISGAITPNAAPVLFGNSTLNNFNPQVANPLAPGTVVQIYGQNLAPDVSTPGQPLPTNVIGTQVLIGGEQAALYYVSPTQIDAQLPVDLAPEHQYQVLVNANGALTLPQPIWVSAATPGLLTLPDGSVYAQHVADGSQVTAASPAKPNEFVTLYMVGLGATDLVVPTGQTTPNPPPFANAKVPVTVTIDNNPAPVQFAGLTPGGVGLYQVNVQVPANAVTGNLTVVVMQGTLTANSGTLPVQQ